MIRLEKIRRTYPDFQLEVDLTVDRGEIITLLGHSGSGKTTTLRILAGFEPVDAGRILLDDRDVTRTTPEQRGLGIVFQDFTLFPHLDVGRNIAYGLRVKKMPPREQRHRVEQLLDLVGLSGFADRPVHTLSGGEQQRIAVARALAPEPRALLLDEPFSAIDTERRESLRRHLVRIQRKLEIPTVFVTHSRTEALYLSDRILVLREGRIEDEGSPQNLYERPRTEYAARFLGPGNIFELEPLRELMPAGSAGMPAGAPGTRIMIRPERVGITGEYRQHAADGDGDDAVVLPGTVTERAYYGSWWEYTVDTILGAVQVTSRREYRPDSDLELRLAAEHLVAVTADSPQGPAGPPASPGRSVPDIP